MSAFSRDAHSASQMLRTSGVRNPDKNIRSTKINPMPDQSTFSLRISRRAKDSFDSLHAKSGFKNRNLTFEALVLSASDKDIIDPRDIAAIKVKLDSLIELLEAP